MEGGEENLLAVDLRSPMSPAVPAAAPPLSGNNICQRFFCQVFLYYKNTFLNIGLKNRKESSSTYNVRRSRSQCFLQEKKLGSYYLFLSLLCLPDT